MTEVSLASAKKSKTYTLGIDNNVCTSNDWRRIILYDFDGNFDETKPSIVNLHENTSYLIYSTKHGHHLVGLTPLSTITWALLFDSLDKEFGSFYAGGVIRLMLKRDEIQRLVKSWFEHPIIPRLYKLYSKRFSLPGLPSNKFTEEDWHLVPRGYHTGKS